MSVLEPITVLTDQKIGFPKLNRRIAAAAIETTSMKETAIGLIETSRRDRAGRRAKLSSISPEPGVIR